MGFILTFGKYVILGAMLRMKLLIHLLHAKKRRVREERDAEGEISI